MRNRDLRMYFVHISVCSLNAKIDIAINLEAPKSDFSPQIFIFILKGSEDIRSAFGGIINSEVRTKLIF